jgi:hypothetical protein
MMDTIVLDSVCKQIYQKFPEFSGVRPSIKQNGENQLLIFKTNQRTSDGLTIQRTVRVTVNLLGKIIKTTTSR